MTAREVIFTVNGPGELHGVAVPLAKSFQKKYKDLVFTLFIVPCQFGSGLEDAAAKKLDLFHNIFSISEYKKLWLKNILPANYQPKSKGIVFYTGGDGLHAMVLAKKFSFPAYAYTHDTKSLSFKTGFIQVYYPDRDGNTMVDAALERKIKYQAMPIGSDQVTVGLYPGSRPAHLKVMVDFLSKTAIILNKKYPNIKFIWGIPDSLKSMFEEYKNTAYSPKMEAEDTAYDLVISLTGTNTAINAVLGIPMVILLPFNYPKLIPLMGLLGIISELPGVGILLKYLVLNIIKNKPGFIALPNIKAKRKIVPELKGFLTPEQVAQTVENLLLNISERKRIHNELPIFMGKPGADNITEKFREVLG